MSGSRCRSGGGSRPGGLFVAQLKQGGKVSREGVSARAVLLTAGVRRDGLEFDSGPLALNSIRNLSALLSGLRRHQGRAVRDQLRHAGVLRGLRASHRTHGQGGHDRHGLHPLHSHQREEHGQGAPQDHGGERAGGHAGVQAGQPPFLSPSLPFLSPPLSP
eukprot:976194-Rhodomonas_salina.1